MNEFANVTFHKGIVPKTFIGLKKEVLSFVHIDLDLYNSYRDALAYTYPLMQRNGIYYFDDYKEDSCPGATQAVDEFVERNWLIPLRENTFQKMTYEV